MAAQANIVTCEVSIPRKLNDSVKQTGRVLFRSIMNDCGDAVITFPTARGNSDMVTISGPRDDVAKAKQQLLQFFTETRLSSFSAEVRVKVEYQKFLKGNNGVDINEIRESTGAQISFPTNEDEDKEVITIIGKQDAVDEAKVKLESAVKKISHSQSLLTFEEKNAERKVNITLKHHGHFLSRRGKVLNQIIEECKGVQITFPHTGVEGDCIVIKGRLDCVKAAEERLLEIVKELESMVTLECKILRKQRAILIGTRGCNVKSIKAEFDVQIKFPDRVVREEQRPDEQVNCDDVEAAETDPDYDIVQITGQPDRAEAAKQALLDFLPITIKVDVPSNLHGPIIGQGGRGVKGLNEKYHVHIVFPRSDQQLDYVTITGARARVEVAKEAISEKCRDIQTEKKRRALLSYRLKIKVDSEYHPKIINHSEGDAMKKIMSDNNIRIQFPRIGDTEDNIITIVGEKNDVHNARDYIMKLYNELIQDRKDTMAYGQVLETKNKHVAISPCRSPALSINSEMIDCEGTDIEQKTQNLSNVDKEFNEIEDDTEIEDETEEAEEVQTEIQKLHEKLSVSNATMSLVQKHTNIVADTLKYCDNIQERLTELYNNISMKKEKKIKELKDHLNNQISTNALLKIERTQLTVEINSERELCKKAIHKNQQECAQRMNEMFETMKDLEGKLNIEQKEKSKLISENTKISERYQELLSEHKALQTRLTKQENDIKESMEKRAQLNIEIHELKRTNSAVISENNSKLTDYRKQLEESKITLGKAVNRMNEEISNSMKLTNTIANRAEENERLKAVLKIKINEISKLSINLEEESKNNEKLSKNIQSLNKELETKVKQIRNSEKDFEKYKANVDEQVIKEKADHEVKMDKIKSNIHDLTKQLGEITQDIHLSSENTSNSNSITGIPNSSNAAIPKRQACYNGWDYNEWRYSETPQ